MRFFALKLSLFFTCVFATISPSIEQSDVHNANHVFNAIHSSMRQWGSSLNHNGMSFFLATVPTGTQLYHGTFTTEPVQGLEWLAFEPEHAMIFARPRGPRRDHDNLPSQNEEGTGGEPSSHLDSDQTQQRPASLVAGGRYSYRSSSGPPVGDERPFFDGRPASHQSKQPRPRQDRVALRSPPSPLDHVHQRGSDRAQIKYQEQRSKQHAVVQDVPDGDADAGYLHTYVPKHDLRLLYVDGLSAGKTSNGTLDTQDMLLLNLTSDPQRPMARERDRARGMCNLTITVWQGKIDGILRMEGGFEIILCDFAKHLDRVDIITITQHKYWQERGFLGGWQYIKAITHRYHSIGGDRVKLALDDFVSVFAYPKLKRLFTNDVQSDYAMPRLQNVEEGERLRIKEDVTSMILRKDWGQEVSSRNWQAVADMVVAHYSASLHYMHTNKQVRADKGSLEHYLVDMLHPFIDYTARNSTRETQRCVAQVVPSLPTAQSTVANLAHRTVYATTHHICDTLLTALSIASASTSHASFTQVYAKHATDVIDDLVEYLNWTTWKDCGTCADEEVCYIPIWPMGNHEDHANPKCLNESAARGRWGYWGLPPQPGKDDNGKVPHEMDVTE